ncbi:MFS transporter [Rahnella aceris]|jgi:MFS family permease|uniref:MFS transporter n=1 Tax=Rahnella sp. (strain Y9602) TaxID=2703885 RepID=UPI001C2678FF|nr:MFS transporter [Rahnella aceris]MBU9840522.1 MFS transporter [Rahnella aceris]
MSGSHNGWADLFSAENRGSAITLSAGVALYATNSYIVITILPSVVQDIGGLAWYAWNTTLYVVCSILGSALSARLMRTAGPRGSYLMATAIFIAGAAICTAAPNMPVLLLGRALQGLGGGFLFALSYAMINLLFKESLWPRAMALISAMWGIATLVGPAVGGIFAELHAWRWAFGLLLPVTSLFGVWVWRILPKSRHDRQPDEPLPLMQLALLTGAVLVVSAGSLSSSGLINLLGFVVAVAMILILRHREFTADVRLLPRNALRRSSPLYGLYLVMTLLIIGLGCELFVPYLLQHLHGQTPLAAGYITAAAAAGWTLSEVASSGWTGRRADGAIICGPLILAAGLLLLLFTVPAAFGLPWLNISGVVLGLTLAGFGIGLGWPHLLTRVLQQAPEEDREKAGASITVVQSFAAALGAALAGTVANFAGVDKGDCGAASAAFWMFLLFAVPALLAVWIAWRSVRVRRLQGRAKTSLSGDLSQG